MDQAQQTLVRASFAKVAPISDIISRIAAPEHAQFEGGDKVGTIPLAALIALPAATRAQAPSIPDTAFARLEATALLETLNAELLSHDSATLTLERWCAVHKLADTDRIRAELMRGKEKPATADIRHDLGVGADETIRYRRVRLSCGGRVLSEADNWYVPRLLTAEMNRQLDETDTPFGRAVLALGFSRHTLAAELLWYPLPAGWEMRVLPPDQTGTIEVPVEILRHRAVLTTREGTPFSEVVETYRGAMFDFAWPQSCSASRHATPATDRSRAARLSAASSRSRPASSAIGVGTRFVRNCTLSDSGLRLVPRYIPSLLRASAPKYGRPDPQRTPSIGRGLPSARSGEACS